MPLVNNVKWAAVGIVSLGLVAAFGGVALAGSEAVFTDGLEKIATTALDTSQTLTDMGYAAIEPEGLLLE